MSSIEESYNGRRFKVIHCSGAIQSFKAALAHLPKAKAKSFERAMILQIKRLANGERMSKENFRQEGELPSKTGHKISKKFYALKRIPIRGYCWLSEKYPQTYFISHYVYKDYKKLKASDTKIVGDKWKEKEGN
ncbi:hypothetical protein ACJJI4_12990 [Microbulbifer sp. TRSA002]|uniref:hypothetical protein n=1 Tax=Microbulbifer sp. TRSA002 TaxID=3243382 RepID=UPI00403A3A7C